MGLFERLREKRQLGRSGALSYVVRDDVAVPASIGISEHGMCYAVAMSPQYGAVRFAEEGPMLAAEHNAMGPILDDMAVVSEKIDRAGDALAEGRIYDAEHHLAEARDTLDRLDASSVDITGMAL
jgi:hypothetical protein